MAIVEIRLKIPGTTVDFPCHTAVSESNPGQKLAMMAATGVPLRLVRPRVLRTQRMSLLLDRANNVREDTKTLVLLYRLRKDDVVKVG